MDQKVETSQALIDIKEEKVAEVMVEDEKLLLTYNDGTTRIATKETQESFAELLEKAEIHLSILMV